MTETDSGKKLLPDVQAYLDTRDQAFRDWFRIRAELALMYAGRQAYGTAEERAQDAAHSLQWAEYRSRYRKAQDVAWETLSASSDPLVAWVGRNGNGYRYAARVFLSALPATLAELDALARKEDWCGDWSGTDPDDANFRQQLLDAGFFSGEDAEPESPAVPERALGDLPVRELVDLAAVELSEQMRSEMVARADLGAVYAYLVLARDKIRAVHSESCSG